ncbi:MAG TPA: Uma2 family endonuclease [Pyrinomonadaceae bacterium]|jgi:Uma2 family endonuclease
MSQGILTYVSPDEYLRLERQAEYKSEYLNGEIFAMSGASRQPNLITANIGAEFNRQLKGKPCEAYASDMRVKVRANGLYTYPDVIVVCGEPQFEDKEVDTLLNPTLLVEVLSQSTERYDRIAKTSRLEQYAKQPNGQWSLTQYTSPDEIVKLPSINCSLRLGNVYDKVTFDPNYRVSR